MMTGNHKGLFFIILAFWFLVNLIQASFTEIMSDEAYYGLYGTNLAWGYFDHPPMVALLTKISSIFFNGNLGVRFMTVLLQVFTLYITWKIIDERNQDTSRILSFYIIAGSICMFCIYGFITAPDVALLFFTAFFLYSYKKFLGSQSLVNLFSLSVSMAGLVYSKYHGVLVIGLVVFSNIRLLRSGRFWVAGIIALILFSPHIFWQAANDFPTFRYHLVDRSEGFKWRYVLEYLPNQLAVFNPVVLGATAYIMLKFKPADLFARALYFLIAGFIGFFGLTALRGHVEPHWTISCSIAMIILLYNNSMENPGMFRFLRNAFLPTLLIIFMGRIILMSDIPIVRHFGFKGKEEKYRFIGSVAKDLPVLFSGSFQGPSLYWFFNGKEGIAISSLFSRKTQFDIWQREKKYANDTVFIYGNSEGRSQLYEREGINFSGFSTDSLQTINRIGVEITVLQKTMHAGDSLTLTVVFSNPYPYDIDFNHRRFPVNICMALLKKKDIYLYPVILKEKVGIMRSGETIEREVGTQVPELPGGDYTFGICLNTILGPAINDSFTSVKLEAK
jgi:hypothetical protein